MMYKATSAGVIPSAKQKSGFLAAHGQALREGVRDGTPIALGYLAVAFTLGIAARSAGLTAFQGFLAQPAEQRLPPGNTPALPSSPPAPPTGRWALMTLITNARYLLMSCALSQKFAPDTPLRHRFLVGYDVTDEIFGIAIARPGSLDPYYNYGAMLVAMPGWAVGTALGILAGDVLPLRVVSALSVALYGMFLAVIVPPARKNKVVAGVVAASFLLSFAAATCPCWPLSPAVPAPFCSR